jgi:anti-sigma B factor antagonist
LCLHKHLLDTLFDRPYFAGRADSHSSGLAAGFAHTDSLSRTADMSDHAPPVSVVQDKDVRIVEFTNNKILDEANIQEIGQTLEALINESNPPKLLLDFATVDHLSSAALGTLINVNNKIKSKNGMFRLANIRPQILEVFRITKLDKLFRIHPTREEALRSFFE